MTTLTDLTISQLNQIIAIKEQIEKLQGQLDSLGAGGKFSEPVAVKGRKRRRMSAVARARIAAGARARWAKIKTRQAGAKAGRKAVRRASRAVKAKLAAIAKARWAKAKAEGKKSL